MQKDRFRLAIGLLLFVGIGFAAVGCGGSTSPHVKAIWYPPQFIPAGGLMVAFSTDAIIPDGNPKGQFKSEGASYKLLEDADSAYCYTSQGNEYEMTDAGNGSYQCLIDNYNPGDSIGCVITKGEVALENLWVSPVVLKNRFEGGTTNYLTTAWCQVAKMMYESDQARYPTLSQLAYYVNQQYLILDWEQVRFEVLTRDATYDAICDAYQALLFQALETPGTNALTAYYAGTVTPIGQVSHTQAQAAIDLLDIADVYELSGDVVEVRQEYGDYMAIFLNKEEQPMVDFLYFNYLYDGLDVARHVNVFTDYWSRYQNLRASVWVSDVDVVGNNASAQVQGLWSWNEDGLRRERYINERVCFEDINGRWRYTGNRGSIIGQYRFAKFSGGAIVLETDPILSGPVTDNMLYFRCSQTSDNFQFTGCTVSGPDVDGSQPLVLNNQASGRIYIGPTDLVAGDSVTINSMSFIAGTNFALGGSTDATASNLAVAINAAAGMSATSSGSVVTVTWDTTGVAGNDIEFEEGVDAGGNMTLYPSDGTLDGAIVDGGTWVYELIVPAAPTPGDVYTFANNYGAYGGEQQVSFAIGGVDAVSAGLLPTIEEPAGTDIVLDANSDFDFGFTDTPRQFPWPGELSVTLSPNLRDPSHHVYYGEYLEFDTENLAINIPLGTVTGPIWVQIDVADAYGNRVRKRKELFLDVGASIGLEDLEGFQARNVSLNYHILEAYGADTDIIVEYNLYGGTAGQWFTATESQTRAASGMITLAATNALGPTAATGVLTLSNQNSMVAGDSFMLNINTFTVGAEFAIGADAAVTASNIAAAVNSTYPGVATANVNSVDFAWTTLGTDGNNVIFIEVQDTNSQMTLSPADDTLGGAVDYHGVSVNDITYLFGDNVTIGADADESTANLGATLAGDADLVLNILDNTVTITYGTLGPSGNQIEFTDEDMDPDNQISLTGTGTLSGGQFGSAITEGAEDLASSPDGIAHIFVWDSFADLGDIRLTNQVVVRIIPYVDGVLGVADETTMFTLDNYSLIAALIDEIYPSTVGRDVTIDYYLYDGDEGGGIGDPIRIEAEYSIDGGTTWLTASEGPDSDGLTNLQSGPNGDPHVFVWDSILDLGTANNPAVRFRVAPYETTDMGLEIPGAVSTTFPFHLDNSTAPAVTFINPIPGVNEITIEYTLGDTDGSVKASGTTTLISNNINPGDGVEVNGVPYVLDTDFLIGPDPASTAFNLAEAINATDGVAASSNASVVTIMWDDPGVDGNIVTFTRVGGNLDIIVSGTGTLAGGMNGQDAGILPYYSVNDGATFYAATEGPGSDGMGNLSTSPDGTDHIFIWDSRADLGSGLFNNVVFRIMPYDDDGNGTALESDPFDFQNPTAPSVNITTPTALPAGDLIDISYTIFDGTQDDVYDPPSECTIQIYFSIDAAHTTWTPATEGPGSDGTAGLSSDPVFPMPHTFVWDSRVDLGSTEVDTVMVRIVPRDTHEGTAGQTQDFSVRNIIQADLGNMNYQRAAHKAIVLQNGLVLITGGGEATYYGSPHLNSAEIYAARPMGAFGRVTINAANILAVGDGVEVNGTSYIVGALETEFAVGADDAETAANLAALIDTTDGVTANADATIVTIVWDVAGTVGNAVTFSEVLDTNAQLTLAGADISPDDGGDPPIPIPDGIIDHLQGGLDLGDFVECASTMISARGFHTTTLLENGRVLLTGGQGAAAAVEDSAETFDPVDDWPHINGVFAATAGTMTNPRWMHTADLILINGYVLIIGGYEDNGDAVTINVTDTAELYNPASNTFAATGPLNDGRAGHVTFDMEDGTFMILGGMADHNILPQSVTYLATAEVYSVADEDFTLTSDIIIDNDMTAVRGWFAAGKRFTNDIYLFGGVSTAGAVTGSIEVYDEWLGQFSVHVSTLNTPRYRAAYGRFLNTSVAILSGVDFAHLPVDTIEWFDMTSLTPYLSTEWGGTGSYDDLNGRNAWTNRTFAAVVRLNNDTLMISGGGTTGTPSDRVEMFDNPPDF